MATKNAPLTRELNLAEGQSCFSGQLWVPDDLEVIEL